MTPSALVSRRLKYCSASARNSGLSMRPSWLALTRENQASKASGAWAVGLNSSPNGLTNTGGGLGGGAPTAAMGAPNVRNSRIRRQVLFMEDLCARKLDSHRALSW